MPDGHDVDAETSPRVESRLFQAIAESTHDWESWVGPEGQLRWVNQAVERISGYPVAACLDMLDYPIPLIHEDDRDRMREVFWGALGGTSGNDVEFRVLHRDGSIRWASVSWQPLHDESQGSLGYRTSIREISERKAAEEVIQSAWNLLEQRVRERTAELEATNAALRVEIEVRARAKERLRLSEERFELAFRASYDGIWDWDLRTNEVVYTPRCRELMGVDEQTKEDLHAYFWENLHPEDQPRAEHAIRAHLEQDAAYDIQYRLRNPAGEYRWLHARGQAVRDATGRPIRMVGAVTDVTDKRLSEERLAWLASFPELSADIVVEVDEAGSVSYLNPTGQARLADVADQGLQHPFLSGIDAIRNELCGEMPCETSREVAVGPKIYLQTIAKVPERSTTRIYATDITARKRAERDLDRFFQLSLDEFAVYDLHDGTIVRISPSVTKTLGWSAEEIVGRPYYGLIHPEDIPACHERMEQLGRGEPVIEFPVRLLCKDDSYRVISWTSVPVVEDGLVYGVGRDMTDRQRSEREIRDLNAQLQLRLERIAALHEIDLAITNSLDVRATLGIILDQARAQLGVDAAEVLILNGAGDALEFVVDRGLEGEGLRPVSLALQHCGPGLVARSRRALHVPDLRIANWTCDRIAALVAQGYRAYSAIPLAAKGNVTGVLEVFHRDPPPRDPEWHNFLETLAGQAGIAIENARLYRDLQRSNLELHSAYEATIEGWARALDLRDHETEGHSRRVTEMSLRLARALGLEGEDLVQMRRGALLHDIGKMAVPDAILNKPGPLTAEERRLMEEHPRYAFEMLEPIPFLKKCLDIPYCHHERWDGKGYPRGLRGQDIPRAARIFAAVDIWDALSYERVYRKAWPREQVHEHLRQLSGTHLEPIVVEALLLILETPTQAVSSCADIVPDPPEPPRVRPVAASDGLTNTPFSSKPCSCHQHGQPGTDLASPRTP